MARIVYGIMGDSRGHLSRSLAVAQSLPDHEFLFVGGGTIRELKAEGHSVVDVPVPATIRRDNKVDVWATVTTATKVFFAGSPVVRRLADAIKSFDPDLILTDYEFFTPLAARKLGLPCVSLDHQHVLTHCRYTPPPGQLLNRFITCTFVRQLYSFASRFLIISFYELPALNPSTTEVFPAIVRSVVANLQPSQGEHGLVYLADRSFLGLLPVLEGRKRRFIVYGIGEQPSRANLVFKEKSTEGFAQDMASCKYVISNAGHSLISEALFLGKPVLAFPREFEYEQFLNGHFLAHLGYGAICSSVPRAEEAVNAFEAKLELFETRIREKRFAGNQQLVARVEQLLGNGPGSNPSSEDSVSSSKPVR